MSSVAKSDESQRNSPDHKDGISSTNVGAHVADATGNEGEHLSGVNDVNTPPISDDNGVQVVEVVVVDKQQSSSTRPSPRHSPRTTLAIAEQYNPNVSIGHQSSLPKHTRRTTIATDIIKEQVDTTTKTTTMEMSTTTTRTPSTATATGDSVGVSVSVGVGGAPSSLNNRRRTPLSQQSGHGHGGEGDQGGGGGGGGGLDNVLPPQGNNGHSVAPTGDRGLSRACCFCWCCCCSCSRKDARCLTVRNNEENSARTRDANKLEILNGENEPPPTLEDIRAWGESFDRLMRCSAGRKVFRDFLRCEYSEENILFWLACEELKRETNAESVEEKARLIYEDYISILSPKEVSLDSRVREVINRNMVEPSPHTFDEAQLQIYTLMHRDSYPRFVNSPMYKKLAQMNTSSRKESSA